MCFLIRPLLPILTFGFLIAAAPTALVIWMFLWLASFFLPTMVYHTFDDKLYSWYQRCVLLFFEPFVTKTVKKIHSKLILIRYFYVIIFIAPLVDWVICNMIIARQGGIGRLRFILLNALKYIPVFGYYFYQHCFVFVNRDNFAVHRAVSTMDYIKQKELSCWVVTFPEVDRYNPKKPKLIQESRAFAKSKGLPTFDYHLTPRVRGVEVLINNMRTHLDAVYDVTVVFGDENGRCLDKKKPMPGLFSFLLKPRTLHVHLQRCPIADVPSEHDTLRQWLCSRFALKDKLFRDLDQNLTTKVGDTVVQPDVKAVAEAFARDLSVSKVPNGFKELPHLRKRWLFTALACLGGFTLLLLFAVPYGPVLYFGSVIGTVLFGIPYLWLAV
ncbi:unnamed protein product [Schistocephalus solidus]|uniref:PlsC domain-containing protein n=1 Tax=Schistocephalus solidus TaxID=70667 RepID=A0A183SW27_SCHSO|nr:unnamed protein product [Schistocephalus solidus]